MEKKMKRNKGDVKVGVVGNLKSSEIKSLMSKLVENMGIENIKVPTDSKEFSPFLMKVGELLERGDTKSELEITDEEESFMVKLGIELPWVTEGGEEDLEEDLEEEEVEEEEEEEEESDKFEGFSRKDLISYISQNHKKGKRGFKIFTTDTVETLKEKINTEEGEGEVKKTPKKKTFSRPELFTQLLINCKGGYEKGGISEKYDKQWITLGGKSSKGEAEFLTGKYTSLLVSLGFASCKGGKVKLTDDFIDHLNEL